MCHDGDRDGMRTLVEGLDDKWRLPLMKREEIRLVA